MGFLVRNRASNISKINNLHLDSCIMLCNLGIFHYILKKSCSIPFLTSRIVALYNCIFHGANPFLNSSIAFTLSFCPKIALAATMIFAPASTAFFTLSAVIPPSISMSFVVIFRNNMTTKDIEIGGGITADNVKKAVDAGANIIVAANAIFGQKDRVKAIEELRNGFAP